MWAWHQANVELASCCVDLPYSSVSQKYRCESCGWPVYKCTCRKQCECGAMVEKWSWRYLPSSDDVDVDFNQRCRCLDRPRATWDWARFDLNPRY